MLFNLEITLQTSYKKGVDFVNSGLKCVGKPYGKCII